MPALRGFKIPGKRDLPDKTMNSTTHKSHCPACHGVVFDSTKRFTEGLGFVCPPCHEFLTEAEKVLKRVGIEGISNKQKP